MALETWTINFVDGGDKTPFDLDPAETNGPTGASRTLDIELTGNGTPDWGEKIEENLVHLLENFSSPEDGGSPGNPDPGYTYAPTTPTKGQLWFNSTDEELYIFDGTVWKLTSGTGISNIVEDVTPQLGGTLDTQGNAITGIAGTSVSPGIEFNDGASGFYQDTSGRIRVAVLGASNYFEFYQDEFRSNLSSGPSILSESASATNPVLCPNRNELGTGIGSTVANILHLITNGTSALTIDASQDSVFAGTVTSLGFGYDAANLNTWFGSTALDSITAGGTLNTAIGHAALTGLTNGDGNTAVGQNALAVLASGNDNVAIGNNSLAALTGTGVMANIAIGSRAMALSTAGVNSIAIGKYALEANVLGTNNIAIGHYAGSSLTSGSGNVVIGASAVGAALTNNIVIANGTGAIKAQHDGTSWSGVGGVFATQESSNLNDTMYSPTTSQIFNLGIYESVGPTGSTAGLLIHNIWTGLN